MSLQHAWWEAHVRQLQEEGRNIPREVTNGLRDTLNIERRMDARHDVMVKEISGLQLLLEYCREIENDLRPLYFF
jgi:hypothetical protein